MKKFKLAFIIILGVAAFWGALYWLLFTDDKKVIYKGEYKDKTVKVYEITHLGFSSNTFTHTIKYDDLKPIPIDWSSTDNRGIPYDDSVFGTATPLYIDKSYKYNNDVNYDDNKGETLLYISNKDYSEKDYLLCEDFFKNNWLAVQKEIFKNYSGFPNHIIGIIHGDRQDFIKIFKGNFESDFFNLTITPDGEIILGKESNIMMLQNSGLSDKVQMPGKIILKKSNEVGYSPNYDTFKDKNGKTINDYFKIVNENNVTPQR